MMTNRWTTRLAAAAALAASSTFLPAGAGAQTPSSVTIVREVDSDRYDPHRSTARAGTEVLFMLGDTLVSLDFDLNTIRPGLATSWTVSPDGKTYTVYMMVLSEEANKSRLAEKASKKATPKKVAPKKATPKKVTAK